MKNLKWKQNNPADEMIAIISSISGDASNIIDNSTPSPVVSAGRIEDNCKELLSLIKLLPPTKW